jgi:hypothetical protein
MEARPMNGSSWATWMIRLEKHKRMAEDLLEAGNFLDGLAQLEKCSEMLLRAKYDAMNRSGKFTAETEN